MTKRAGPASIDAPANLAAASARPAGEASRDAHAILAEASPRLMLPLDQIGDLASGGYVGLIDDAAVECLKVRLEAEGLLTPIWVRRNGNAAKSAPYSIIAGRHRLQAARALGWSEIAAEVRAGPSSSIEELRRMQLVENLDRRELRPIERALFIMDRWQAAAVEHALATVANAPTSPQSAASRHRWSVSEALANTPSADRDAVDDKVAAASGASARTVRRYRKIFAAIVVPFPDHFAQVNAHPLGASLSAITTLAQLQGDDECRRKAIETLLDPEKDWPNMAAVLEAAELTRSNGSGPTPAARLIDGWSRADDKGRRRFAVWMAEQVDFSTAMAIHEKLRERNLLP